MTTKLISDAQGQFWIQVGTELINVAGFSDIWLDSYEVVVTPGYHEPIEHETIETEKFATPKTAWFRRREVSISLRWHAPVTERRWVIRFSGGVDQKRHHIADGMRSEQEAKTLLNDIAALIAAHNIERISSLGEVTTEEGFSPIE